MIGRMGRMSFLVSTLLAFALAATVLSAALLVGLFPTGGGTAVATTRPPGTFAPGTPTPTATPAVSAPPATATPEPTIDLGQGGTYVVKPGDYLSLIGEKLGIPWQLIADANGIEGPNYTIVPGQVLIIPPIAVPTQGADFYIVQSGDTITAIAEQFGITPTALADYNNIADWNSIQVGDRLFIPADENATPLPEASF
jgi:LysM repeat protein